MAFHNSPFNANIVNKRIEGEGTFTFEDKSVYEGSFKDGQFHGQGTIFFTNGSQLEAKWEHGKAFDEKFTFADGLLYKKTDWEYCTSSDRRFYREHVDGLSIDRTPRLQNDSHAGVTCIASTDRGYCVYDPSELGKGHLLSFDGEDLGPPTKEEKDWLDTISLF